MAGKHSYTHPVRFWLSTTNSGTCDENTRRQQQRLDNLLMTMPDEPRRSGRATKGQHKNLELPDTPAKKGKGKGQKEKSSSKASAEPTPGPSEEGEGEGEGEEEEEIIRCICGEYEEEEDVERDMICCDNCSAWQHNDCMGLQFTKGEEPDQYYCEQCRPENHKALLEKIAKGEKPWEEVAERRRHEAEEKKLKRKKSKKGGKKSRPSEGKIETGTPVRGGTSATPGPGPSPATAPSVSVEPEKNGHAADSRRSSTNKRKLEEVVEEDAVWISPMPLGQQISVLTDPLQEHQAKQQRTSSKPSPAPPPKVKTEPAPVVSLEEPDMPARKSVANALVKFFVDQIAAAQKQGSFSLPSGQTAEYTARQLGFSVESAIYENMSGGTGEPAEPYKSQFRSIMFNVKKNTALRDRLLVGSVSPESLSTMKSAEMASEELQRKDAEIKREAERQHIIIQEKGPRIRRTHKGEEIIEEDNQNVASEPVFSQAPRRATDAGSPGNQSPITPKVSQSAHGDGHGRGQSPDGGHGDHVFPEVAPNIREPVPHGKLQGDADIDKLLDDEEPDSPPYSPKDFQDDGVIWRGKISMIPVAEFSSSAQHVAGADLSARIPWSQLAPEEMTAYGRIDIQRANSYLCGLQWSASTDVSVIAVNKPQAPRQVDGFNKLFDYFHTRNRYGVIRQHPLPAVKDTYVIPLEEGATKMPDFIALLDKTKLPDGPIDERMLLIVFVVKTRDSNPPSVQPPSHRPSQEPAVSASPLTAAAATPHNTFASTAAAPNQAAYGQQPQQPNQHPSLPQPLIGNPSATQILGPQANAPAIQQLLKTAPNVDNAQLTVVRDIIARQPAAALNYETLMQALFDTQANGHVPNV
ncbi:Zinc finger PHD-type [Penicillium angulare]|uniref:Zinc finger PHD-type n=1 Tax=Penicillium angulare TaxID=116970 RepID=UPI0025411186|nr:Zinc finger PHD-type [Penicillium angulare]KAJ5273741.1 Zinc finger PHD-type [Penicillium angulare]